MSLHMSGQIDQNIDGVGGDEGCRFLVASTGDVAPAVRVLLELLRQRVLGQVIGVAENLEAACGRD
jgi:hypothetical protein